MRDASRGRGCHNCVRHNDEERKPLPYWPQHAVSGHGCARVCTVTRRRTVVAVPGVGAFIADTEASRTLTSDGNVTGSSSSTHSLSSPSLCRGTAPDPQEHSSLVFF